MFKIRIKNYVRFLEHLKSLDNNTSYSNFLRVFGNSNVVLHTYYVSNKQYVCASNGRVTGYFPLPVHYVEVTP